MPRKEEAATNFGGKVFNFFTSAPSQHRFLKAVLGFPVGFAISLVFYFTLLADLQLPSTAKNVLGLLFGISLTSGFAFFVQVRCVTLLAVPYFVGQNGLHFLSALCMVMVFTGPVASIMKNFTEASRSLSCSTELAKNQTEVYGRLTAGPILNLLPTIDVDSKKIYHSVKELVYKFKPIIAEIEENDIVMRSILKRIKKVDFETNGNSNGVNRAKELQADDERLEQEIEEAEEEDEDFDLEAYLLQGEYLKMAKMKCMDIHNEAYFRCSEMFDRWMRKCYEKFPWGIDHLLCWPLKYKGLCRLARLLSREMINCDLVPPIPAQFGKLYVDVKHHIKKLPTYFEVHIQYKVEKLIEFYKNRLHDPLMNAARKAGRQAQRVALKTPVSIQEAKGRARDLQITIEYVKEIVIGIFTILRRLVDFIFFTIIFQALLYHHKYLGTIDHDNTYINSYFKRIDDRRYRQGKRTLLPLKKLEAKDHKEALRIGLTGSEIFSMALQCFVQLIRIGIYLFVFKFDLVFFTILAHVRDNAHIEFTIDGIHEVRFIVHGDGIFSKLIQQFLDLFNHKEEVDYDGSSFACLPQPYETPGHLLYNVMTLCVIQFFIIILKVYFERGRQAVCGFFYRRRHKERTLYMYNKLLKSRITFLRRARYEMQKKAREFDIEQETNLFYKLAERFPILARPLKPFVCRKCLICEDNDDGKTFVECPVAGCRFAYCAFCWRDVEAQCYACRPSFDDDDDEIGPPPDCTEIAS